jgi:hypothetical protein
MLDFKKVMKFYGNGETVPQGYLDYSARNGVTSPNTCAIRLSYAIWQADGRFFRDKAARRPWREWFGFPIHADELAIMLTRHEMRPRQIYLRSEIAEKTGIIFLDKLTGWNADNASGTRATGHIGIWNGKKIVDEPGGANWFERAERIYFYDYSV